MNSSTPGGERRASPFSLDFVTGYLRRLAGVIGTIFSSPRWTWRGGVALVFSGTVSVAAGAVSAYIFSSLPNFAGTIVMPEEGWTSVALTVSNFLAGAPSGPLLFIGLIGVYAVVSERAVRARKAALLGTGMAGISAVMFLGAAVHEWLVTAYGFETPAVFYSVAYFYLTDLSALAALMLSGVAAFQARGLRWKPLLLVVGLISAVPAATFLFTLYPDAAFVTEPGFWQGFLMWTLPNILPSVGLIAFGLTMLGAKDREARMVSEEKRETGERNLALARRLYEVAWRDGDLYIVDDIVSEDFLDKRRNRSGLPPFKQAISDLHHAFPDLKVEIEEQTAEGDVVTTRIAFSGTDTGGVLYFPPTNRTAKFSGAFSDRFEDGKLVEHDGEMDERSLMEQLGHRSEGWKQPPVS